MVWSDPSIQKSDPRRSTAKVILLAFTYGAGVPRLSEASGLSHLETEQFLGKLFAAFPTVRDLTGDHAVGGGYPGAPAISAKERGQAEGLAYIMTGGGRRFSMPSDETYKAVNGLMQGTGADVLKSAIVRLDQAGLSQYIIAPVHDEVVFSFPKDEDEQMAKAASAAMEDHDWEIPLTVDTSGPFSHWGGAYGWSDDE
jgi:DNA polymerase I-like protein with 3'-5' exonuclease and polymerase domains